MKNEASQVREQARKEIQALEKENKELKRKLEKLGRDVVRYISAKIENDDMLIQETSKNLIRFYHLFAAEYE